MKDKEIDKKSFIIADRLKKLRERNGYSHEKLSDALRDKYGIKISSDSLMNYEVLDEHHSKAGKNLGMRVEYLRYLSDFYGVSSDYILGLSKDETPNPTAQAAIAYTGLSEVNVNSLHYLVTNAKEALEIQAEDQVTYVDGCRLVLDCFNDLFDALMGDRKTAERIAEYYIRMRQESGHLGEHESDVRYILAPKTVFVGTHSEKESNIIVEHSCVKIGHEIENKLKRKYMCYHLTDPDKEWV